VRCRANPHHHRSVTLYELCSLRGGLVFVHGWDGIGVRELPRRYFSIHIRCVDFLKLHGLPGGDIQLGDGVGCIECMQQLPCWALHCGVNQSMLVLPPW
jgi:hypothetical protein